MPPQQPYQAPPQQSYQAPQQQAYQAPKAPVPSVAKVFRPENFYIQVSTGQNFPLLGSEITVGRNPDNVIVLDDTQVSGYHLMLSIQAEGVLAWDNSTTNGTLFNGAALVGSVRLSTKDVLQVGSVILQLREVLR
jgi:pSer/pThr/pTyr-binding forkhead associated (FHA) protein